MRPEAVFPDRTIDVNGVRTRCRQAGQDGPPVVLIHGLGDMAALSSFFIRVR
ncbi:MAG TPA: hypothetical protein VF358_07410 [Syntrophales bacterium]